jgi:putative ABC transport system permease protein
MGKAAPPRLANWLLRIFMRKEEYLEKSGDLEEVYHSLYNGYGKTRARVWYWTQLMKILLRSLTNSLYWRMEMVKNYLKLALRIIRRQKAYSFINILGLSVGITCCLMIFLFVRDELSFEKFHTNANRIYRTIIDEFVDGKWEHNVGSPDLLGPALIEEYPEITSCVRLFNPNWIDKWAVAVENKYFYEDSLFFADPTIFDVFTFPLLEGNPKTALKDPNSLVLTESMSRKYFGDEDPMGKTLTIQDAVEVKVTGVAKDVPQNTHFRFDFLVSFESIPYKWALNTWRTQQFYTYVLLDKEYSQDQLDERLSAYLKKHFGKQTNMALHLQPIQDIHLFSRNYNYDLATNNSDITYVYIFSTIALFILAIACINFMNLSTARSTKRAKEVGIRKVIGAHRSQLIKQFLSETFLFCLLSAMLSVVFVLFFLPQFNGLAAKNITLNLENVLFIGTTLLVIVLVVGFFSGSYPALFLSGFRPIKILKGSLSAGNKGVLFRRALVFFQFTISIGLIIGTFIVRGQIQYCLNRNLGFEKEQVVVLPLRSGSVLAQFESFRNELLQNSSVLNVAGSSTVPGRSIGSRGMFPEGNQWYPRNSMFVDYDFIPTLGIKIVEGRNFSMDYPTDLDDAYIVNEAAVKSFGWDHPIGKKIIWAGDQNKKGNVIGVVKDFHYASFHEEISPLVLHMSAGALSYLSIRLQRNDIFKTMSFLEDKWKEFYPGHPFDYFFLDDSFNSLYRSEEKMGSIFQIFTVLGLFISCLGLYGLSSYLLEQRTKEIGIRKVLGASLSRILVMVSKEFVKWIVLANIAAWPIIYFAMKKWLEGFAYRISIPFWAFLLSAVIVITISLLTISYQSAKAAMTNPADSLRYE